MIKIPFRLQKALAKQNNLLQPFEHKKIFSAQIKENNYVPVFIIAPPRSGSTLSYQLMVNFLQTCYFSNLSNIMYLCPVFVSYLSKNIGVNNPPVRFESYHGTTNAWNEPSIGLNIWGRWFEKDQSFDAKCSLNEKSMFMLRGTVHGLQNVFFRPFVGKWQGFNSNLESINTAFPDCMFIRVSRDYKAIARSILKAREDIGSRYQWFSSRTSAYSNIISTTQDPITQICAQIIQVEKDLDDFISKTDRKRVVTVNYDEICQSPKAFLFNFVSSYYEWCREKIYIRNRKRIPENFKPSSGKRVSIQDEMKIKEIFNLTEKQQ